MPRILMLSVLTACAAFLAIADPRSLPASSTVLLEVPAKDYIALHEGEANTISATITNTLPTPLTLCLRPGLSTAVTCSDAPRSKGAKGFASSPQHWLPPGAAPAPGCVQSPRVEESDFITLSPRERRIVSAEIPPTHGCTTGKAVLLVTFESGFDGSVIGHPSWVGSVCIELPATVTDPKLLEKPPRAKEGERE